jgi:hypothetical protein
VFKRKGTRIDRKIGGLGRIMGLINKAKSQRKGSHDPIQILRKQLTQKENLKIIETNVLQEMDEVHSATMNIYQKEGRQ